MRSMVYKSVSIVFVIAVVVIFMAAHHETPKSVVENTIEDIEDNYTAMKDFQSWGSMEWFSNFHPSFSYFFSTGEPLASLAYIRDMVDSRKNATQEAATPMFTDTQLHNRNFNVQGNVAVATYYFTQTRTSDGEQVKKRRSDVWMRIDDKWQIIHRHTSMLEGEIPDENAAADTPSISAGDGIWAASSVGNIEVVKQHLAKGVDIDAVDSVSGITPLAWAVIRGQSQMAELLVQHGADVNAKNNDGGTSLHAAAFLGRVEIVKLLVQHEADINAKNNDGETPMDSLKADWGTTEFIARLLQIKLDRETVETGRNQVADLLKSK